MDNANDAKAVTLTKSDSLAGKFVENTNSRGTDLKAASEASSSSFLSEVYNWGAHKAESAKNLVQDHPYLTAGIVFAGAVALTKGQALVEGVAELASKQTPTISEGAKRLGIPLSLGAALALAGCSGDDDDKADQSNKPSGELDNFAHKLRQEEITSSMSDVLQIGQKDETPQAVPTNPATDDNLIVKNYKDPQDCANDGIFTEKYCKEQYDEALKQHIASAPKFESKEECESKTGKECVAPKDEAVPADNAPVQSGADSPVALSSNYDHSSSNASGNSFVPYMIGYMMASSNSRTVVVHDSDDRASANNRYTARPLYTPPPGRSGSGAGPSEVKEFIDSEGAHVGTQGSRDVAKSPFGQSAGANLFKGSAASRIGNTEGRMGTTETHSGFSESESEEHFGHTNTTLFREVALVVVVAEAVSAAAAPSFRSSSPKLLHSVE
jgi:uncharacterized protein YgiB involved in biofilm formation